MNIYEKLSNIQNELKCNKNQFNKFGGYKYRSCEDILEAVKPLCKKNRATLILSDELENIGDRYYIKATATLVSIDEATVDNPAYKISNTAYSREEENKKGMDGSQITGTASSYARKYALNGLFNIDDTKDADTDEFTARTQEDENKKITKAQTEALYKLIEDRAVEKDEVIATLKEKGYEKLADIKIKDYMFIVKHFENFRRD